MGMREDLEAYQDQYGLVQNRIGGSSGNGLCFTGEVYAQLWKHNALQAGDREEFKRAVLNCEKEPGLLMRHPLVFMDQNSVDDHYAVAVACIALGIQDIPQRILKYGRAHHFHWGIFRPAYYYCSVDPYVDNDVRAWYGRQVGLIGLLRLGAGEQMSFSQAMALAVAVGTTGTGAPDAHTAGGQDAYRLSYLVSLILQARGGTVYDWAVKRFQSKLKENFPGGMPEVYRKYFGHSHWLAQYAERGY